MKFETKYKILLFKGWFDKGFGISSSFKYIFYFLALWLGFNSNPIYSQWLGYIGGVYLLLCVPIGWAWYKYKWMEAEQEVSNRYNLAWKEVRERLIKNKNIK